MASHIDFKTATTGVAAKAMRNELGRLVSSVSDQSTRKVRGEMIRSEGVGILTSRSTGIRCGDAIFFRSFHPVSLGPSQERGAVSFDHIVPIWFRLIQKTM